MCRTLRCWSVCVALRLGHINVVGDILVVAKALKRVLLKVCVEVAYARWDRERVQELISDAQLDVALSELMGLL